MSKENEFIIVPATQEIIDGQERENIVVDIPGGYEAVGFNSTSNENRRGSIRNPVVNTVNHYILCRAIPADNNELEDDKQFIILAIFHGWYLVHKKNLEIDIPDGYEMTEFSVADDRNIMGKGTYNYILCRPTS